MQELRTENEILRIENEEVKELNEVKNRVLGLLGHHLKEISYSQNKFSEKINFLIQKNRTDDVLQLGDFVEKQSNRFIKIISQLIEWTKMESNQSGNGAMNIKLDGLIKQKLNEYTNDINEIGSQKELTPEVVQRLANRLLDSK